MPTVLFTMSQNIIMHIAFIFVYERVKSTVVVTLDGVDVPVFQCSRRGVKQTFKVFASVTCSEIESLNVMSYANVHVFRVAKTLYLLQGV